VSYRGSLVDTVFKDVVIGNAPQVFEIAGGGIRCVGGNKVEIWIENSEIDISYSLYKDNVPTEIVKVGTGSIISFGLFEDVGEYTIWAENT